MVDVYLGLKKYKELRKFLKEYTKDFFSLQSSSVTRGYTMLLLEYISRDTPSLEDVGQWFYSNPRVVAYLLDCKPLPDCPPPRTIGGEYTDTNIVTYVRTHKVGFC
jgi:hypothetical protein